MSITKIKTNTGQTKWEVRLHLSGRGSKRLRRRFDRKVDADLFFTSETAKQRYIGAEKNGASYVDNATFASEVGYWLSNRSLEMSPGHLKRANGIINDLMPSVGSWVPGRFDARFIIMFQTEQLATGLTSATVNRKVEVIKAILKFSFENRRIKCNPLQGSKKLKEVRQGTNFWNADEATKFLTFVDKKYPSECEQRWVYVVYLLALNTAIRAGEIWGLKPQDIKDEGLLLVERQYDRVSKTLRPPKSKRSRRVPCNETLTVELKRAFEILPVTSKSIFVTGCSDYICHETFVRSFFKVDVRESGVRRIRFHDMRHTAATLMLANGVQLNTVKEICGHASITTTMNYVHLLADSIKDAGLKFSLGPAETPAPIRPLLQIAR
jgi:integrase